MKGVLLVVAGAALLLGALGNINAATAGTIAGVAIALFGVCILVHAFGLCKMCPDNCESK